MDLREYLFRNRIKISTFARSINYGRGYVTEIINGTKTPGKKLAKAIEEATNGQVTINEVLNKENRDE